MDMILTSQHDGDGTTVANYNLDYTRNDNGSLNGLHGGFKAFTGILNGLQFGIENNGKGCWQIAERSSLDNGQPVIDALRNVFE